MKKIISLTLTLCMLLSMLVFPARAASAPTLSIDSVTGEAGKNVFVNLMLSNNTAGMKALDVVVLYDKNIMTCNYLNVDKNAENADSAWAEFKKYCENNKYDAFTDEGIYEAYTATAVGNYQNVNVPDGYDTEKYGAIKIGYIVDTTFVEGKEGTNGFTYDGVLGMLRFKINADAESVDSELIVLAPTYTDGNNTVITDQVQTVNGKITVNGVTPTIKTVSLDKSSVTVNGTERATVKAQALSAKGTDITNGVAWSVSGGNDVLIAEDGTITVAAKAKAGTYTITASAKEGSSQGSADNKLTVTRAPAKAATITLTRHWTDLVVPYNGQSGAGFLATVKDQYGDERKNAEVKWSITPQVDGVSINENSGEITVLTKAKDTIANTTGMEFTVTATCGDAKKIEKFTVKRAAAEAETIVISGADAVTIPTGDTAATKNYTAEVKDQYDSPMAAQNVEWSVSQATGVSMANGNLTVDKTAQAGDVTITATVKESTDVMASKTVKLQSVVFTQTAAPTVKENPTYGDTWSMIVTSIGSYSAKVGDDEIPGEYSLKDADARPDAGKQTYTILFNSNDGTYKDIVVATGEVTVQPYTLTVNKGDIAVSKTYDGTTAVTAGKVTGKLGYTDPSFGDELSITYTNATFDNANVASASKVTFSGLKLEGAKAANYKLNVDLFEVDAKISKASLTIKAKDNTITYGDAPAENGFTVVSGLCGNDTDGVVTGVTYTYNYQQGGNVGSYTITPAGGEAANYEVKTYESGTLTVNPKALPADAITAIGAVTYNGTAQAPALNVVDGTKVLTADTDYTAVYSNNTNAGTAKVVITGKGNYSGTAEQTFTINKKPVTVTSGIAAVNREYNGTTVVELDCTKAVFGGLIDGDNLTVAATGTMKDAHAGSTKEVTISGLTLGGTSAGNYVLAETGNQATTTVNISKQAATALTLTAKNAVYTAAAYDAKNVTPSRNANDVKLTYYADNNGQQVAEISTPVNVGTYWVSGKIDETTDISAAVATAVKFQIIKAPLTVTANANTITYGDAPAANGYTVSNLRGSDTESVVSGVGYAYSYKQYGNVGAYTITPKDAKADNYEIEFVSGELTVEPKNITPRSVTLADKTFDNTTTATVTAAAFDGLVNNDSLVLGTDFTATAVYDSANASTAAAAKATVSLGTTDKAKNYTLTNGNDFVTHGVINKAVTTLTGTAKNAAYTGVAYDAANLTWNSNLTAPTVDVTYYSDAACTQTAQPINVGKYWAKGVIVESTNQSSAEAVAAFEITKTPLTIKANDKTITYGEALANDGAEYTGLVNGENKDVVSGLTYAYNYTQYGNVGTYTITPKDATAANYDIKFVPGKLTVEQKEVGLTWNNAGTLYYDGKAKNVTATATGVVNDDEIAVTVAGGKQTAIGSYSAAATGLTGAKAGNYKLPAGKTQKYTIKAALTSVTVTPSTITATIDGLTIKLVGYASGEVTVSADGATVDGDKLTVNGVEYTIDKTGVKTIPAVVSVKDETSKVEKSDGAEIDDSVVEEINNTATKGDGLNEAAANKIAAADKTITEDDKTNEVVKVEVQITLNIQPKTYKDGELTLNIEPEITYTYVKADGTVVRTSQPEKLENSDIKASVTISVKLPADFNPNFAKHHNEMIPVTVANGVATWQQSSFSEVTLVSDTRTATITFQKDDGSTITKIYTAANLGEALPTDSRAGHTFNGWTVGGKTYKTLTDEALTAMAALAGGARTLTASFTQNGGGSVGGGGGVATYPVSVDKAENGSVTVSPKSAAKGGTVTIEVKPDEGYELASVTVLDKDGKKLDVTLKNGKYSFVMPDGKVSIKAEFAKKSAMSFADVAANSWYYDAVKYCFDNGLMNGVGEDKFAPSATTTRAMIWTVLARDAGVDTSTGATWYEAGMKWAMENKISDGTGAENAITREQFATMLYRVAQSKGEGFTGSWYFPLSFDDAASISDWADEAMHWCVMKGILNGSNNKLNPTDNASRAEVAAMLMRFLTLDK